MNQPKSNGLILGTAFLAFVIAAAAYFFYFSPTMEATAATRAAAFSQQDANQRLQAEVASLAERFANLPQTRAEIAEVHEDIPPAEALPEVIRTLVGEATIDGVTLSSLTIGTPAIIGNTVTLADAAAAVGKSSYVEGLVFQNLTATSFTVTGIGDQARVIDLIDGLQLGDHRYLLVETVTMTPLEPAAATTTLPEILPGYVSFEITGSFFTLITPDMDPTSLTTDPDAEPAVTLGPSDLADPARF